MAGVNIPDGYYVTVPFLDKEKATGEVVIEGIEEAEEGPGPIIITPPNGDE